MYLKKLEIFGFKSFAEKTVLNFEPGITAVVGPNGCGKSNIFDSIRWVLGEQSVKELRGTAMEDVIFNGTDRKSGLGFAEVNLTFSNESRMLPTEYDEVTVTRRLFRSGESEYLLNKTIVRLKDILELFMGTGIGAEAYSLVQQGRVDLIVSAHPEDRRIIIDEAAGITKYKSKKKEALSKLQDTDNNLLRINDIILEVKRQIASLERQANKARKYKEEFEKLKTFEVKLARCQLEDFSSQMTQVQNLQKELITQETKLNGEVANFNGIINQENNITDQLQNKISEVYNEEIRMENQTEIANKQIGFNDERTQGLYDDDSRLRQQKEQLLARCRLQQEKIQSLNEALSALRETMQNNTRLLTTKRESLIAVASAIKETKDSIKKEEEKILDLTARQVSLKNDLTEIMKEFQGSLARKRRLDMENEKVTLEKDEIDNRLKSITENIEGCTGKIGDLRAQHDSKHQAIEQLKNRRLEVEKKIDDLEKKRLFLKSQKEFIAELKVQYQDLSDPAIEGTLLTSMPLEKNKGIIGKVKGTASIDAERLASLKAHFPKLQAENLYEIVCETKFIELDPQKIADKIEELSREIEIQSKERENILLELKTQEDIATSIRQTIHDLEKVLSSYEAQRNNILEESNKLLSELDIVTFELRESRNTMAALKNKEDELGKQLELVEQEIHFCHGHIKEKQDLINSKSEEREETTVTIAQLETEIGLNTETEKTQSENLKMFEEAVVNAQAEVKIVEQDIVNTQARKQDIEKESLELRAKIEDLSQKKESLKDTIADYEKQKDEVILRLLRIEENMATLQKQIEDVKTQLHTLQMKSQEVSFSEKSIKDRLVQTYKINIDEIPQESLRESSEAPIEQPMSVDQLTAEIEQLRKRCEAFGSVNLVAIEEFDELKQRFEFLAKQQSDLLTAKESLHDTITKINKTTRQLFLDTFTKVSEEFRIYFRMLFGGGEAQLLLVDPENVLESGIEIIARPPGKKLQSISLLSGGEKSLAAIALIFGVFKVRPSPFCILDEIDAALDESNVGRFGYLLKDFSKISQFIVITHNKKTITNANVLYGITMQETGISKIVSVKLGEEQPKEAIQEVPAGV